MAVGVALLAAGGWWVLRAPAIERQAVAPPPDIDIDPPAMRARREAALALALMPDDPWTFAESLAASAPAAGAGKDDCGIDGRARFSEAHGPGEAVVQVGGVSARHATAQARLDAALRSSTDPLDRAVADWLNVGNMRSDAGRDEAVVQQASVATDPRLYALGFGLCRAAVMPAPSCRSISLDRWLELDAGNGIPWLWALARAQERGDEDAARAAMSHLASATRFDVRYASVVGAIANRVPQDDPDLAAVDELAVRAAGDAAAMPLPSFQPLLRICRRQAGGDVALAQQCRTIGDVMFDHSDTFVVQGMSGALLLQATGDGSRRDVIVAERAVAEARWSPATGFSECHEMRESLKRLRRRAQVGDVEAMREEARKFVTP
jgi:hypothetical protein